MPSIRWCATFRDVLCELDSDWRAVELAVKKRHLENEVSI
nr:MAG TPA: hypothetical protein [Caudoviricetes sp.]